MSPTLVELYSNSKHVAQALSAQTGVFPILKAFSHINKVINCGVTAVGYSNPT